MGVLRNFGNLTHDFIEGATSWVRSPTRPQEEQKEEEPAIDLTTSARIGSPEEQDDQKHHYFSKEQRADIESAAQLSRLPDYSSGDSVVLATRSGSANMTRHKKLHRSGGFQPHDSLNRKSGGAFAIGKSEYLATRNSAITLPPSLKVSAPSQMSLPERNRSSEPPPKKPRLDDAAARGKALHSRLSGDVNSPYFGTNGDKTPSIIEAGAGMTVQKQRLRSPRRQGTEAEPQDRISTQPQDRRQARGDGFSDDVNVNLAGPGRRMHQGSSSEATEKHVLGRKIAASRSASRGEALRSKRAQEASEKFVVDYDLPVKRVMTQDGLSEEISSPITTSEHRTSTPQNFARTKCFMNADKTEEETDASAVSSSQTAIDDQGTDELALDIDSTANLVMNGLQSNISMEGHHSSGSEEEVEQQEESSEDEWETEKKSAPGFLLMSYDDISERRCGKGTHVTFNKKLPGFIEVTPRVGESVAIYYNDFDKVFIGTELSALLEAKNRVAGQAQVFWASMRFANNKELKSFHFMLRSLFPSRITELAESNVENRITKKRTERDGNLKKAKTTIVDYKDIAASPPSNRKPPKQQSQNSAKPKTRTKLSERLLQQDRLTREAHEAEAITTQSKSKSQHGEQKTTTPIPRRSTRPVTRNAHKVQEPEDDIVPARSQRTPFKQQDYAKHPWTKALVYPATGTNRATVEFADLQRLDDDQLLNDNLVSFGIRFVQHKYLKDQKVYVFNTFFYSALTNQAKRTINYDAVKRWTAKVDLFSYDHVVVPINEGLHWYMAIVCNIKNILKGEQGEPSEPTDDEDNDMGGSRKHDPTTPTIVTLDSLGSPRSPVVRNLKDYLVQEAKAKRGEDIPDAFLKRQGMSAKGIPTQSNLSDCGVFLLIYLFIFFQEPTVFIPKLLTKTFSLEYWEGCSDTSLYRDYMTAAILLEYDNQEGGKYLPVFGDERRQQLQDFLAVRQARTQIGQTAATTLATTSPSTVSAISQPFKSPMLQKPAASLEELGRAEGASIETLKTASDAASNTAATSRPDAVQLAQAPSRDLTDDEDDTDKRATSNGDSQQRMQTTSYAPHPADKLLEELEEHASDTANEDPVPEVRTRSRSVTIPAAHSSQAPLAQAADQSVFAVIDGIEYQLVPAVQVKRTPPASQEAPHTQAQNPTEDADMLDFDDCQSRVPMAEDSQDKTTTMSPQFRLQELKARLEAKKRGEHADFAANQKDDASSSFEKADGDVVMGEVDDDDELAQATTSNQLGTRFETQLRADEVMRGSESSTNGADAASFDGLSD